MNVDPGWLTLNCASLDNGAGNSMHLADTCPIECKLISCFIMWFVTLKIVRNVTSIITRTIPTYRLLASLVNNDSVFDFSTVIRISTQTIRLLQCDAKLNTHTTNSSGRASKSSQWTQSVFRHKMNYVYPLRQPLLTQHGVAKTEELKIKGPHEGTCGN